MKQKSIFLMKRSPWEGLIRLNKQINNKSINLCMSTIRLNKYKHISFLHFCTEKPKKL